MEQKKKELVDFLSESGVLKFGNFVLKSGRCSPYFVNAGDLNNGASLEKIGTELSRYIPKETTLIFGLAYKGIPIAASAAIAMKNLDRNVRFAYNRKESKNYGEATHDDFLGKNLIGKLYDEDKVVLVDDVITDGKTKYETVDLIRNISNAEIIKQLVMVDRQEVDDFGKNAVEEFMKKTEIPIESLICTLDIYDYFCLKDNLEEAGKIFDYLKKYGTEKARSLLVHCIGQIAD